MNIRLRLTLLITKGMISLLRLLKKGGTTLPGEIAYRLYPGIIKKLSKDIKTIMVTGTNGKTTTTRIIGQMFDDNNIKYLTNKSGANLVNGIASTFIDAVDLSGKKNHDIALLEIDEAAFNLIADHIKPDVLVVTNFFRDQLDRYGELYSTLNSVKSGIQKSPNTTLILNADDSLCASLGTEHKGKTLYYGFDETAYEENSEFENTDASFCIYCKNKYEYSNHVYGHLGGFACNKCGYKKPETRISCSKVIKLNSSNTQVEISIENKKYDATVNLPGLYNVYNALSAVSSAYYLNMNIDRIIPSLQTFECGFGRMETINANGKLIKMILVKNPTGFNQVLDFLLTEEKNINIAFIINDKIADGTDVSWLWDVDFEKLKHIEDKVYNFFGAGIRAEDMSVRLKYAGIESKKIIKIKNNSDLIEKGLESINENESFYILPTYTSMLNIRGLLVEKFNLKEFWK